MARDVTVSTLAEISAALKRPVLFFEGEFTTGTLRCWTGVGDRTWNGQVWSGLGTLMGISEVEETAELVAKSCSVSLQGESQALLAINLGACRQGLPGKIWLGFLDDSNAVIADPFLSFSGRFDIPDINDDGVGCVLTARYESSLAALTRATLRRYTHEDQQIRSAGDRGFEYVPALQDAQIPWGRAGLPTTQLKAGGAV